MVRQFGMLIFLAPLVLLLGSHLGGLHPLGDSLAVFRGPLAIIGLVSVLLLVWLRFRPLALVGGLLVGWSAYSILEPKFEFSAALDTPYSLYQKNMLFKMPTVDPVKDDILDKSPDFITLQEVSAKNRALLAKISGQYPSQQYCSSPTVAEVAVASKWPMVEGSALCNPNLGLAIMQVITPDGPVWVVSLHLIWAYPFSQAAQVTAMLPTLEALDGPVVLGGDFNMVPWSHTMRVITSATGTQRIGAPKYTFPLFEGLYTLPIDHVLISDNTHPAETWMRPQLGSDHFGLLARFYLP